ncbi:MAG: hypothetical protein JO250_18410 [Armatimonadetes bacterium]|nr:hypothetical protein [Armatimonadota bacterium]
MTPSRISIPSGRLTSAPASPDSHRLHAVFFHAPGPTLPNGLPRTSPVRAEAAFRLGGEFHLRARVVRLPGEDGPRLEVEAEGYDLALGRPARLRLSLPLLRALYREMGAAFVRAQAADHARREGRN